ncbi:putative phage abortive infection protein [Pseudomonas rossensis]|uniref:putative phage abortive infection protein n=1 Tax=Pseudomonas rossensis TaxID=2305471 RepID=UPI0032616674
MRRNRQVTSDGRFAINRLFISAARWVGVGRFLMLMSVSLIGSVGLYVVFKLSYGIDLPYVGLKFIEQSDKLGQFGDFFGGVLNPLLSFMALLGVLYTIRTQGKELKEAREETRIANRIQDKQTGVFERQNFESVFFRLIDVHAKMAERIRNKSDGFGSNGFETTVKEVLQNYRYACEDLVKAQRSARKPQYPAINPEKTTEQQLLQQGFDEGVVGDIRVTLAQYYRNIYQILKLVDGFKVFAGEEQTGRRSPRQIRLEYFHKRQYSNILRAQLSDDELKLLFFNCITPYGQGLKSYVEQYSLMKHLQKSKFLNGRKDIFSLYEDEAYADYEDIETSRIILYAGYRARDQLRATYNRKIT